MTTDPAPLPTIGWKERIDLPDWGVRRLRAKVDTGARTSALHVARYDLADDGATVRLWLDLDPRHPEPVERTLPVLRIATVRSSIGMRERRPVVTVAVRLGNVVVPVEFTLTNRERMRYRVILGRRALAGRFAIDPGRAYLLPRPPRRDRS